MRDWIATVSENYQADFLTSQHALALSKSILDTDDLQKSRSHGFQLFLLCQVCSFVAVMGREENSLAPLGDIADLRKKLNVLISGENVVEYPLYTFINGVIIISSAKKLGPELNDYVPLKQAI